MVCLASGPSLTCEDTDAVRGQSRVITVNTTYRLAPWADVHYSSDHDWYQMHLPEMRATCSGEFWTGHPTWHLPFDVRRCAYDKRGRGVASRRGVINWGGNSGYCAMGLAYQFGAARILLLGYDQCDPQGAAHWHGEHPKSIRKEFNWAMWTERFDEMARDFTRLGVEVINCSRVTALRCFRRASLEDALRACSNS